MLYDCKRISYWIDRRLSGLAGPDYDTTISFGLPLEPEDSQYGKSRLTPLAGDTRTMKTDKKGAPRLQTHLLLDRPAIDWPCRT